LYNIFAMALSPEEFAAGAAALSTFVSNAKYVEMIVDIAFAVVPSILGLGAAGLIGSSAIRTAKDVMNSISLLQTLDRIEKFRLPKGGGGGNPPPTPPPGKKQRQETEREGEGDSGGGGGGGNPPPTPPEIKPSEKKEENTKSEAEAKKEEHPKPTGIDAYSPIDVLNPFKKK
jgi:hypothetical protein